ncbi:MAG: pyridoxamine kinase [Clostridia bacterium]|nr:pyridoxamine kinase [Clostridia bacterium]
MKQKRIVTIQDLSCFGKCSLTVALPVISALGIETVVLPTAVLSTHTGGFEGYTFHSLEKQFESIAEHWEALGLTFDAIHVGYIGSCELIDRVEAFINRFKKEDTVLFIDPAMADNGKFYSGLDKDYANRLSTLCKRADFISPNITEALIMTNAEDITAFDPNHIKNVLLKLAGISKNPIVTGIHNKSRIETAGYDEKNKDFIISDFEKQEGVFFGSGDLFSAAFIALYIQNKDMKKAVESAAAFVSDCIKNTLDETEKYWYGLKFEQSIPYLIELAKKQPKE